MSLPFQSQSSLSQSSLLKLLVVLEWILLSVVAIAQISVAIISNTSMQLLINGLGLFLFAALRLKMPQRQAAKFVYTAVEFGLIFFLGAVGNVPLLPMLFIVLVIRNCVLLEGRRRALVTGLAFLACIGFQTHRLLHQELLVQVRLDQFGSVWVGFLLVFGLVILFLHLLVDVALKEHRGQAQLAAANARLRQYALRVEALATVQERDRIARDIHDSLGHSLTVFGIHLEAALRLLRSEPDRATALLLEIKQLNSKTLQEVRQSVTAIRADPLQSESLQIALDKLISEFQRSTGLVPTCDIQLDQALPHELNVAIYRIVQESLTNICKYAAATEVKILVIQSAATLQAIIQDNGKGFNLDQNTTGFGLQGMQERTLALGGSFKVVTSPYQGCQVSAIFPHLAPVS
jgi:signal transduction histidine kinase